MSVIRSGRPGLKDPWTRALIVCVRWSLVAFSFCLGCAHRAWPPIAAEAPGCPSTESSPAAPLAPADAPQWRSPPRSEGASLTLVDVGESLYVFGLTWFDGGWALATKPAVMGDTIGLHPVVAGVLGPSVAETCAEGKYGEAVIAGEADELPWLVLSDERTWEAVRFDGSDRHTVLRIRDEHVAVGHDEDWRGGPDVVGVAGWEASEGRELSKAQRRRNSRRSDRHARRTGTFVVHSSWREDAVRVKYRGQRGAVVSRGRYADPRHDDVYGLAVAAGEAHWVGAHWVDDGQDLRVVVNLFDYPSALRTSVGLVAPSGAAGGIVGASPDGHSYVVSDTSSPSERGGELVVLTVDPRGASLGERRLPVEGWVAGNFEVVDCDRGAWLVFSAYDEHANETLSMVPLEPSGELPEPAVLWTREDPRPEPPGARPARVLLSACGPSQAAVAVQMDDRVEMGWGDLVVLSTWSTRAPG